ncbi:MAG: aldolase/citrate lyase family protein [Pseudomonadales bacterium]|nr:aldolase/citrate lyase family protein [Pseudomonadales bacterium]
MNPSESTLQHFAKGLFHKALLPLLACLIPISVQAAEAEMFNTVKMKLARGEQVVGGTISTNDLNIYCAMANAGFDFLWIEMQHSPLTYAEVATMIRACPGPAIPFIRVPTDSEGDIQKAVDIGALGVIVPMVDSIEKIRNAIAYAKYPPVGRRSQGGGQYGTLWGRGYRQAANDNIMIVAMIENPAGIEIADQIAGLEHVDVVFAASSDIGSFTGMRQGDAAYEALITRIKDATLAAGKYLAGPSAWKETREGYTFFQGPPETALIRSGARLSLEGNAGSELQRGLAPIEGQED